MCILHLQSLTAGKAALPRTPTPGCLPRGLPAETAFLPRSGSRAGQTPGAAGAAPAAAPRTRETARGRARLAAGPLPPHGHTGWHKPVRQPCPTTPAPIPASAEQPRPVGRRGRTPSCRLDRLLSPREGLAEDRGRGRPHPASSQGLLRPSLPFRGGRSPQPQRGCAGD